MIQQIFADSVTTPGTAINKAWLRSTSITRQALSLRIQWCRREYYSVLRSFNVPYAHTLGSFSVSMFIPFNLLMQSILGGPHDDRQVHSSFLEGKQGTCKLRHLELGHLIGSESLTPTIVPVYLSNRSIFIQIWCRTTSPSIYTLKDGAKPSSVNGILHYTTTHYCRGGLIWSFFSKMKVRKICRTSNLNLKA